MWMKIEDRMYEVYEYLADFKIPLLPESVYEELSKDLLNLRGSDGFSKEYYEVKEFIREVMDGVSLLLLPSTSLKRWSTDPPSLMTIYRSYV